MSRHKLSKTKAVRPGHYLEDVLLYDWSARQKRAFYRYHARNRRERKRQLRLAYARWGK